jgi:lipid-binding SYLF domain-containing protein
MFLPDKMNSIILKQTSDNIQVFLTRSQIDDVEIPCDIHKRKEVGFEMKSKLFLLIFIAGLLAVFIMNGFYSAHAGYNEESKVESAIEVLNEIMKIPEESIPPALFNKAYGVAVIPGVFKAGFIIGGKGGRGILVVHGEDNTWSNPSFIVFGGGSIGFQIGAQSSDVILVFKSKKSVDGIIKGKFTLGADAAVAAGPVGRQAGASTDIQFKAEIYSYSRSRGAFAGVSLEGATLQIDDDWNYGFYNDTNITANTIFTDKSIKAPAVASEFRKTLSKYSSQ